MSFLKSIFGCKCGKCEKCLANKEEVKKEEPVSSEPVAPAQEPFQNPTENK